MSSEVAELPNYKYENRQLNVECSSHSSQGYRYFGMTNIPKIQLRNILYANEN